MTDPDNNRQRLAEVERKIKLLVTLAIAQTILLAVILVLLLMDQLLPDWSTLIMFIVIVGVVAYVFRKQLPSVFQKVSRFIFSQLASPPKDESRKDIF